MRVLFSACLVIFSFFYSNSQPLINSFSPSSGNIGTSVLITGTGFSAIPSENLVYFGGVKAVVTSASSTSLNVIVPPGTSYMPISVTTNQLTAYSAKPFIPTFRACAEFTVKSLENKVDFSANSPYASCSGDLDGDGKPDLVVVNSSSSNCSVFKNTSTSLQISFASTTDLATDPQPQGIFCLDLNGDGLPDLVVSHLNASRISVFQNISTPGNIAFSSKLNYTTGLGPAAVTSGDFDGDGKPDLVTSNSSTNTVSLFKNSSSSAGISFEPKVDISTGALRPKGIAAGDIDQDGKPDLVVQASFSQQDSLLIYRNISSTGGISFAPRIRFAATGFGHSLALGDIDGDDKIDIATSNNSTSNFSIFPNISSTGSIQLAQRVDFPAGLFPESIAIADVTGDGKVDVAVTNSFNSNFSFFRNTSGIATVSFAPKVDIPTGSGPRSITIADFDLNGTPDISICNSFSGSVSIFRKPYSQQIFLVDAAGTSNTAAVGLCTVTAPDWSNACADLQTAIDVAMDGDQIWVAKGDYIPAKDSLGNSNPSDPRTKTFFLKNGVKLYGGFTATETTLEQRVASASGTSLNGQLNGGLRVFHVVISSKLGTATALEAFTIKNGNASGGNGGGILVEASSLNINNCIITNNESSEKGGGIFLSNSAAQIINCSIVNNGAVRGGGLASNNSSPSLINCTIARNTASIGGGVFCEGVGSPAIFNSILWGNFGEGRVVDNISSTGTNPTVNNSIVGMVSDLFPGTSNVNANPLFLDGEQGNFTLSTGSFAVASGSATLYPFSGPSSDVLGNPRLQAGILSLGAYQGSTAALLNQGGVIYVNKESTNPFATGRSWSDAFRSLSDALAISNANLSAKQIWVAKGSYAPSNDSLMRPQAPISITSTFAIKRRIKMYGGFIGTETDIRQRAFNTNATTLDANFTYHGVDNKLISLMSCVNVDSCLVDGFTFTGGGGNTGGYGGGGAYTKNATIVFSNCRFIKNAGSALYNFNSRLTVSNCYFSGNFSQYGGAIEYDNCTSSITDCKFIENKPPEVGFPYVFGGAISANSSFLTINRCEFRGNKAVSNGGAFYMGNTKATVSNCSFVENSTNPINGNGGAIQLVFQSDMKLINCAFVRNVSQVGAAIDNHSSLLTLINCTITNHTAYYNGGIQNRASGCSTLIYNSIIWGNKSIYDGRGDNLFDYNTNSAYGSFTVSNSLIGGSLYPGAGNMNANPRFVDTSKAFVQLLSSSPAIDAGNNTLYPGNISSDRDLDNHVRLAGTRIDMGAYEFSTSVCEGGSTSFSSNLSGNAYRWEMNTGSGFGSIYNDNNFNGVNAATLTIAGIPVSFNGAQFRCLVDGNYSTVFPVTVNKLIMPSISIVADTTSVCAGSTVRFIATAVNEGDSAQYQWKINDASAGFNINEFSTNSLRNNDRVTVMLTSNASCLSAKTVESNAIAITVNDMKTPSVVISASKTSFCKGETVSFTSEVSNGGSSPGYLWTVNGKSTFVTTPSFSSDTLSNDARVQVVLQSNASCLVKSAAESNIIVLSVSSLPAANAGANQSICAGATTLIGSAALSNHTYMWSPATGLNNLIVAEPTAAPLQTTTYTVTVTNSQGCRSIDTVVVTVKPLPLTPTVSPSGPVAFCNGSSIVLNSSAATYNQWLKDGVALANATGSSYTAENSGSYAVYTKADGCNSQASQPVVVSVYPIPATPTISISSGIITSSSNIGNQWYFNGVAIQGATAQTITPVVSGIYTVKVTENGCASNFSNEINFVVTAINSPELEKSIRIFPNPVHEKLFIRYKGPVNKFRMSITDIYGRLVYGEIVFSSECEIDLSSYATGVYIIRMIDRKGAHLQEFVIKK